MEDRIAHSPTPCLLARCARILKPETYGSPVAPPFNNGGNVLRRVMRGAALLSPRLNPQRSKVAPTPGSAARRRLSLSRR